MTEEVNIVTRGGWVNLRAGPKAVTKRTNLLVETRSHLSSQRPSRWSALVWRLRHQATCHLSPLYAVHLTEM
jgi:hypothetical protein